MNDSFTHNLQQAINSKPCPVCGKHHAVRLNLIHSSASPSTVNSDTLLDTGREVITIGFSDDSCEGFKERVTAFFSTLIKRDNILSFPFPEDM